jgi:hypothetical protein
MVDASFSVFEYTAGVTAVCLTCGWVEGEGCRPEWRFLTGPSHAVIVKTPPVNCVGY